MYRKQIVPVNKLKLPGSKAAGNKQTASEIKKKLLNSKSVAIKHKQTVPEIKKKLKLLGAKATGNKPVLLNRLFLIYLILNVKNQQIIFLD